MSVSPGTFCLSLSGRAAVSAADRAFLVRTLRQAARLQKTPLRQLSVRLLGDAQMIQLHKRFLNLPGTTDVLSFELEHDAAGQTCEGELAVCVAEARRQAQRRGLPTRHEVLLYCLHGMLHLSGFDDKTPKDFQRMHRREDQLLRRLGVGRVFSVAAPPSRRGAT